jgi:hypothetical protein
LREIFLKRALFTSIFDNLLLEKNRTLFCNEDFRYPLRHVPTKHHNKIPSATVRKGAVMQTI